MERPERYLGCGTRAVEDFEATEGETQDLHDKLMEVVGWKVTDKEERENVLTRFLFEKVCKRGPRGPRFL